MRGVDSAVENDVSEFQMRLRKRVWFLCVKRIQSKYKVNIKLFHNLNYLKWYKSFHYFCEMFKRVDIHTITDQTS